MQISVATLTTWQCCLRGRAASSLHADMTSWLRKYTNFILHRELQLLVALFTVCTSISLAVADGGCASPLVSTCEECLRRGPECGWCIQEGFLDGAHVSQRCDSSSNLIRKGCLEELIETGQVRVEVDATVSSTQVAPSRINVQLQTGSKVSFVVEVQQLDRYPVDLYYLVDVSASMKDNLERLNNVGVALSHQMRRHSSDVRMGFGSFVDKPVSPYISIHPSKILNPCSEYDVKCRPTHGFIHVLPITENVTEFTRIIQEQRISGNMDTPEGGFDAMLQAAVCQKDIGWRPEAKHLLLVMTDQPSHLALDSKLAGIVVPHDGRCHLVDNTYTETTNMEHPTIGQLGDTLLRNNIYSIFAVDNVQYKWYEDLLDLLPGSYLGRLMPKATNLKDLVVDAYKKLLSEVEVEVEVDHRHAHRFWVNVSAICPPGGSVTAGNKCSNVKPKQKVFFNITVGMSSCPDEQGGADEVGLTVRPVGFNETVRVTLEPVCSCKCNLQGRCLDETETLVADDDKDADACADISENAEQVSADVCRPPPPVAPGDSGILGDSGKICHGRGACVCGQCVCDRSNLGAIYGKYCEMDDFSCPYRNGLLCGGRGQCALGECVCQEGWTGESCECAVSTATCLSDDGQLCSGRGQCVCGRCVCDDSQYSGDFCEKCPTCHTACQAHWRCVDCHLSFGLGRGSSELCNRTCAPVVGYVDDIDELASALGKHCLYPSTDRCNYRFHMGVEPGSPQLQISRQPECLSSQRYFVTFLSVFVLTVVLGLGILAVLRIVLRRRDSKLLADHQDQMGQINKMGCSYGPTTNEKTVTYRRDNKLDNPVELRVHVPKMPLETSWQ
ncbi:integrin beta-8 [Engraulis encrasicolus]|uniref:integrin beta-8 n=1 Tax=Engraulis encrasicolus TaxID=184585 RepID=UPI002FD6D00C